MEKFIARYVNEKGINKSYLFNKSTFDEISASKFLNDKGIKNFFMFFEPYEPIMLSENNVMFRGDVGFDITAEKLIPHLQQGRDITFDSFGGDLWEGLKIYDLIKMMDVKPKINILGSCASACTLPFLAVPKENRTMSENSRFLIHNPWTFEAGDDEAMRITAASLEKEKENIANIYANETGRSVDEMLTLMKEEKFLNVSEMAAFNFINSNNINLKDEMDKESKEKLSGLETIMNSVAKTLAKLVGNSPKNIMVQDVNGIEIDFADVATKEEIADGAVGTVDGQLASEDYVMPDGSTYSFEDGVLTIKPAEAEDVEALKAENAALKEELASVQNSVSKKDKEVSNLTKSLKDMSVQVTEVSKELTNFKNQFSEDSAGVNTPPENGEGKTKFTYKKK